jgi:undecaprenyl pyrophosphate phosphatase UppP
MDKETIYLIVIIILAIIAMEYYFSIMQKIISLFRTKITTETTKNLLLLVVGICLSSIGTIIALWRNPLLDVTLWLIIVPILILCILIWLLEKTEKKAKIERDAHDQYLIQTIDIEISKHFPHSINNDETKKALTNINNSIKEMNETIKNSNKNNK